MNADGGSWARTASKGGTKSLRETVRVKLLGGFQVFVETQPVADNGWRLRKAASLVKLLSLAPGHRLHRERVMDLLWPELGMKAASNNLRQALHVARRTLEPASGCLVLRDEQLALCPEGDLWVDVDAFQEAALEARRTRESAAYQAALNLYAGELLPGDLYEGWAEERRGELHTTYLSLLVKLSRLYEEREDLGSAIETLQRAVVGEPTHDEAHAGLMRLYALSGRAREALAHYERLREDLSREFGAEPGAESQRIYEEVLSGRISSARSSREGDRPVEEPAIAGGQNNLPAARTSFVGREREMLEIQRELAMTRLLTLTGPGGTGKTRLALEVAKELVGAYPDGVWLVELAGLSEAGLVTQTVADVLGVEEQPDRPLIDTLADSLREKKVLLVLDNCELPSWAPRSA
jgi:DNA-binding SARP family transcriptional activator